MARATKKGTTRPAVFRKASAAAGRGKPGPAMGKTARARSSKTAGQGTAAKAIARSAGVKSSENELQARVEKLERANVALRAAHRDLQRATAETAECFSELREKIGQLESKIAATGTEGDPGRPADDVSVRSDRDSGDPVPPGVAVSEPETPSDEDRRVLEHINEELGPE